MMRIRLLQVPDCPGAELLVQRLAEAVGTAGMVLDRRTVADAGHAAVLGMTGSPTLLVDGVDPFAIPGTPTSLSCRLYRDEHGRLANAPSTAQLRAALQGAADG